MVVQPSPRMSGDVSEMHDNNCPLLKPIAPSGSSDQEKVDGSANLPRLSTCSPSPARQQSEPTLLNTWSEHRSERNLSSVGRAYSDTMRPRDISEAARDGCGPVMFIRSSSIPSDHGPLGDENPNDIDENPQVGTDEFDKF